MTDDAIQQRIDTIKDVLGEYRVTFHSRFPIYRHQAERFYNEVAEAIEGRLRDDTDRYREALVAIGGLIYGGTDDQLLADIRAKAIKALSDE